MLNKGAELFGYKLVNPFGVPASLLTQDADHVANWANAGYGVLTYKTVRSREHTGNQPPHVGYIQPDGAMDDGMRVSAFAKKGTRLQITASGDYSGTPNSMVNSVGIPSPEPGKWMEDFLLAKTRLQKEQLLILSVTGTVAEGASDADLIADFVGVSQLASQVTPWPIELNLSCPNTGAGLLYHNQPLCYKLVRAVKRAVPTHQFIGKIGYLPIDRLHNLVTSLRPLDGIAAINTVAVPVVGPETDEEVIAQPFFPERPTAGLSGHLIRPLAWEVVNNLVEFREKGDHSLTILAMGGIETMEDFEAYSHFGADAVQSATMFLLEEEATRVNEESSGD